MRLSWRGRHRIVGIIATAAISIVILGVLAVESSDAVHLLRKNTHRPSLAIKGNVIEQAYERGTVDLFVQFRPLDLTKAKSCLTSPYAGLQEFALNVGQRAQKRQQVYDALIEHARQTQKGAWEQLEKSNIAFKSFWINNSLLIRNAPAYVVQLLVMLSNTKEGEDIISLEPNRLIAKLPSPPPPSASHPNLLGLSEGKEDDVSWNLRLIKADQVWRHTKGSGVVMANIDTGVNYRHPLLKKSYRGGKHQSHAYNWYDPMGIFRRPTDVHGHGSHTMGTMVGAKGIGVAPEATWIAAQGCDREGCSQERLLAAAQWVMCPTDEKGEKPRCDLGADVINNSWGGAIVPEVEESMTWFSGAVQAWLAAEMVPIFAQGNEGPACATAGTPGDLAAVIAVGAVDQLGSLSFFSSRGPGVAKFGHARYKPDYVAPGQEIISCGGKGSELVVMSGTSMAAPHLAGMAALVLSLRPHLGFAELRHIVTQSANTVGLVEPQLGQMACHGVPWDKFPNFQYGYGLVDAAAAADLLMTGGNVTGAQ